MYDLIITVNVARRSASASLFRKNGSMDAHIILPFSWLDFLGSSKMALEFRDNAIALLMMDSHGNEDDYIGRMSYKQFKALRGAVLDLAKLIAGPAPEPALPHGYKAHLPITYAREQAKVAGEWRFQVSDFFRHYWRADIAREVNDVAEAAA